MTKRASHWADASGPPDLFCPSCPAWAACGGDASAPCECVPAMRPERPCPTCHVVCRERDVGAGAAPDHAASQALFVQGLTLDALALRGPPVPALPRVVLLETNQLPDGHGLDLEWAGLRLQRWIGARRPLRQIAKVSPATRLVAVPNEEDKRLERFWGFGADGRAARYARLLGDGVEVMTGPTFSVCRKHPALYRFVSLHRHHRVAAEASRAGLAVAPNLFWANDRSLAAWARWLAVHPEVGTLARDLSRTRRRGTHERIRRRVFEILDPSERPFHLMLTGVGTAHVAGWAAALAERGHTFTVLTSDPTCGTRRSGRRIVERDGQLVKVPDRSDTDRLCVENAQAVLDFVAAL